jgi:hypothetical protein
MNDKLTSILESDFVIYDKLEIPHNDCGDEWFPIIYQLLTDIQKISTKIRVDCIKDKYCQMIFYYEENGATEAEVKAIDVLVAAAQDVVYSEYQKAARQKGK